MDLALFFSETQWRHIFLTWSYALIWWKYPIPHYICITAVLEHGFLQRKSFRCCHLLGLYVKEGLVPLHHMLLRSSCSFQDSPHSTSGSAAPGSKGMVRQALKNKLELSTQKRQIHNHHWDGVHRQTDQVQQAKKRQYFLVCCTDTKKQQQKTPMTKQAYENLSFWLLFIKEKKMRWSSPSRARFVMTVWWMESTQLVRLSVQLPSPLGSLAFVVGSTAENVHPYLLWLVTLVGKRPCINLT